MCVCVYGVCVCLWSVYMFLCGVWMFLCGEWIFLCGVRTLCVCIVWCISMSVFLFASIRLSICVRVRVKVRYGVGVFLCGLCTLFMCREWCISLSVFLFIYVSIYVRVRVKVIYICVSVWVGIYVCSCERKWGLAFVFPCLFACMDACRSMYVHGMFCLCGHVYFCSPIHVNVLVSEGNHGSLVCQRLPPQN